MTAQRMVAVRYILGFREAGRVATTQLANERRVLALRTAGRLFGKAPRGCPICRHAWQSEEIMLSPSLRACDTGVRWLSDPLDAHHALISRSNSGDVPHLVPAGPSLALWRAGDGRRRRGGSLVPSALAFALSRRIAGVSLSRRLGHRQPGVTPVDTPCTPATPYGKPG